MTITRSEVLQRAATGWGPPGTVPYSQQVIHQPDGYRCDCSGYVWMCLRGSLVGSWGGPNTVTLVTDGYVERIDPNALEPGDLVGILGPGTEGDAGHVRLFTGWYNSDPTNSDYYCWEQTGGSSGPHHNLVHWSSEYAAYRYRQIMETSAPAYPLAPYPPNVFADIAGPDAWHGGYNAWERPYVRAIQRALILAGCVPGVVSIYSSWADGVFDYLPANGQHPTTDAVERYQQLHGLTVDGKVGPQTWGDMAARGLLVGL